MKSGESPIGSMMTKSVTKAGTRSSSITRPPPRRAARAPRATAPRRAPAPPPPRRASSAAAPPPRCRRASRCSGLASRPSISARIASSLPTRASQRATSALSGATSSFAALPSASASPPARADAAAPAPLGQELPPVGVHVVVVRPDPPVPDQPQPLGDELDQVRVVADEDHRPAILGQRLDQRVAALDVEMVRRLVEDDHLRRLERGEQQRQPRLLPPRQPPHLGRHDVRPDPPRRQPRPELPRRLVRPQPLQMLQRRLVELELVHLVLREIADAQLRGRDLPPAHRRQPVGEKLRQRRLPLPVLPEERDPVVLVDPQIQVAQDRPPVIPDAHVLQPDDRRRQLLRLRES